MEAKLGLLHSLTLKGYEWSGSPDTVMFLIDIADGFRNPSRFEKRFMDDTNDVQMVARKAFEVLCECFFRKGTDDCLREGDCFWSDLLGNDRFTEKVVWFFRVSVFGLLYNGAGARAFATQNQSEKICRDFLKNFVGLGWKCVGFDDISDKRIALRPFFIRVLYQLGNLYWLFGKELDEDSIRELKTIALPSDGFSCYILPRESVYGQSSRPATTIEEAALGGSQAARVLVIYASDEKERARIQKLYDASQEKNEQARKADALAEIAREKQELAEREREILGEVLDGSGKV